jgi:hypothetical protein
MAATQATIKPAPAGFLYDWKTGEMWAFNFMLVVESRANGHIKNMVNH